MLISSLPLHPHSSLSGLGSSVGSFWQAVFVMPPQTGSKDGTAEWWWLVESLKQENVNTV